MRLQELDMTEHIHDSSKDCGPLVTCWPVYRPHCKASVSVSS